MPSLVFDRFSEYMAEVSKYPIQVAGLRVQEVAEAIGVSRSYLSRVVSEKMGKSIGKHLMTMRMFAARELVIFTELKIKEIAEMFFKCRIDYFNLIFWKFYGIPPGRYREIMRGKLTIQNVDIVEMKPYEEGMRKDCSGCGCEFTPGRAVIAKSGGLFCRSCFVKRFTTYGV